MRCQPKKVEPLAIALALFFVSNLALSLTGVTMAQTEIQAEKSSPQMIPEREEMLLMMEIPIVTAAKREQPMIESPSTISVITAEQIRESGATNLPDIFRMVPGIDVLGLSVSDLNVSVRGNGSFSGTFNGALLDRILLLINGQSISLNLLGSNFWTSISILPEDIEQIEIIRGPGAALYGTDAFAGVINIITESPANLDGTRISINGGDLGAYNASVTHANSLDSLDYKLSFGWNRANKWQDRNQLGNREIKGNLEVEYEFNPTTKAMLYAGYGDFIGDIMVSPRILERDGNVGSIKFIYTRDNLKLQTFWARVDYDVSQSGPDADNIFTDTRNIEVQDSIRLGSRNILTMGGAYRLNKINSALVYEELPKQHQWAVYFQNEFKPVDKLALTFGTRYDNHTMAKNSLTPRASITYALTENHLFRFSAGKAFRNPNFVESHSLLLFEQKFAQFNPKLPEISFTSRVQGNPDLNPERVNTHELSYQTVLKKRIIGNFNLFINHLYDLIEFKTVETFPADFFFDGSPGGVIPSKMSFDNRGKAKSIGGEIDMTFYATKWLKGFINYSYQQLTDTLMNEHIKSAPAHKLNGGLRFKFENGIKWNIVAHYISQTEWGSLKVDAYTLVNARVAYSMMAEDAEISASAFNLLNNKHREHPWGDEIGRRLTVGLTCRF